MGTQPATDAAAVDSWYHALTTMTPQRRVTDREDSMERAFALLRDDVRAGFEQVNKRLDAVADKVSGHGEAIAGLKQGCHANSLTSDAVRELSETLAAHRARCPYDTGGDITATGPRWTNAQLAGGVAGGGAAGLVLLEVIKWIVERRLP